jgi:hypothetical protein
VPDSYGMDAPTVRDNDWIQYLLGLMSEGAHDVDEFALKNPVTFVTYNYDRLIEHKMMNHLRAKWRAPNENLLTVLQRIPVIHLHGRLGTITPRSEHVPFGALVGERKPTDDVDPRTQLRGVLYATRTLLTDQEYTKYFLEPLQHAERNQSVGGGGPTITDQWDCLKLLRERVGALI